MPEEVKPDSKGTICTIQIVFVAVSEKGFFFHTNFWINCVEAGRVGGKTA